MAAAGYELRGIYGTEPYWPEKKLTVCVTGAGGFIGSHLAKRLKEEGHRVVACDWKRNEHMEVRWRDRVYATASSCEANGGCRAGRARRVRAIGTTSDVCDGAGVCAELQKMTFGRAW